MTFHVMKHLFFFEEQLVSIKFLFPPTPPSLIPTKFSKSCGCVLTSQENLLLLAEKERKKAEAQEKEQRKKEREESKLQREQKQLKKGQEVRSRSPSLCSVTYQRVGRLGSM